MIASSGGGMFGGGGGSVSMGSGGSFYSPELSTDFLEMPQSRDQQRQYFRHFYLNNPIVGAAIDQHTDIPLSKIRFGIPEALNKDLARKSFRFCTAWAKRVSLRRKLRGVLHEYNLFGEVFIWAEDTSPELPQAIREEKVKAVIKDKDSVQYVERWEERPDADDRHISWLKNNYQGWSRLQVLPPDQIHMESFDFTDQKLIEFIPNQKTRGAIDAAYSGDERFLKIVESMPAEIVEAVVEGRSIPLQMNPDAGSFVYYISRNKSDYEERGHSTLQRCLQSLVFGDKLRQAQTSIASRHMTPIRLVSADDADESDLDEIREQIDIALQDPDYSIITNYELKWEEMGSRDRLLDLTSEYDRVDRDLFVGIGVTESLLTGESSFGGERLSIQIINQRYLQIRDELSEYVEENLLRPMCERMGFVETDEDGNERVLYPRLSFTRMALFDNRDIFDALFNLYQKGSLDIDTIYELLNLDPESITERLYKDLFTLKDSTFNELLRSAYGRVGDALVDDSDITEKIAEHLSLTYEKAEEDDGGRF